ncbi:RNA polymerase sigma factor [Gemmatimonas groenlandica]|uniref:RNA polymerase sigma factor n=1 Tax=Gemmatimonas groenlandica TaxID=2732249 RepID=A0A6M4IPF3_9BACT|nr:RNA polymerase sigma factor [Gemmatimonas groenlandica]QJR36814.1 RNA polymerase sigma factor [Gemmatimonas groenlandica]
MSSLSDDILLDRARSGDEAAFRALVERYEQAVASVVIGMLGAGDDADDVGQETFIRFSAAISTFRGEAALGTYLRRIAMNLSLNALKRRRRFSLRLVSRDHATTPLHEPVVDAYDAEGAERVAVVRRAVAQLGEKQRSVVVLRLLDGLSTNETAEVLDLPPGTVMSRLSRGVAELQRRLGWYANDSKEQRNA